MESNIFKLIVVKDIQAAVEKLTQGEVVQAAYLLGKLEEFVTSRFPATEANNDN